MKTLSLTSPLTEGEAVSNAQRRLVGNVSKRDFLRGEIDGVFGEETGRACIRAKFHLGYAQADLKPTFGDALERFLSGKSKPTKLMRARTAARKKKAAAKPLRVKALEQAKRYVGQSESPPGSNRIAFASTWYGLVGPWCAMAVTRWYVDAGSKAFVKGSRYAYVPYIVADARAGRNGLSITKDPQPGDVVCFDWDSDGIADHVGLFDRWLRKGRDLTAVEGNTSVGNDSNGGQVMSRTRTAGSVQVFVRVGR